ncbi:MAG TPA: DHA2 family efflux MFS transporter permease subunit [Roseiflexaceae bacterium]|nr:DHA2 family efflux MFS transporter permease subunit [Roseiflexaceae bacterium]
MATTVPATFSEGERIDYAATLPHETKLIILAGVLLSLFLAALDQTIVATALPAIVRDFNGIDLVSWISTGYLLASTAMVPIYGKLSDIYGRKPILLWGIGIFLLGSMLCGIAGGMIELIVFRVVQGIGAAAITSTAFATPADLFVPAERAKYMGIFGGVFGLASVVGPFLGGLLTDKISWHWVFYVNVPLGLIALAFVIAKMPRLASGLRARIDWLGTVLLICAVVPLMLGLTLDKSVYAWSSPLIIGMFAVALIGTALFLLVESRVASPIISLKLFRNRTFAIGVAASVLNGAAFFGAVLFLSLFLQNVLGLSATAAGTTQIALMAGFVISSNISSLLVQRFGRYKPLMIAGFVIMITGFVLMSRVGVTSSPYDIAWRIFLVGVGLGPSLPLLNLAMQNAVMANQIGAVTASRQFFQQLGQALGGAVFGVVLATTLTVQLQQNLAPIVQQLPPAAQAQLDPAQFRNSVSAAEGGGQQLDLGAQIAATATASIERQRALAQAAFGQGDAQARAQLLSSPDTLPAVKELVQGSAAADTQALVQVNATLDAAEQQAGQEARELGQRLNGAVKQSFATSITSIYFYAIWLAIAALILIVLWLPEIPLRRSNRTEMPVVE